MEEQGKKDWFPEVWARLTLNARVLLERAGVKDYQAFLSLDRKSVYRFCQGKTHLWLEITRVRRDVERFRMETLGPIMAPISSKRKKKRKRKTSSNKSSPFQNTPHEAPQSSKPECASEAGTGEELAYDVFSVRARNCLRRMRIRTLRQFMELSEAKVLQCQGAGRKTWNEIADFQKHVHSSESGLREMSERPSQTYADTDNVSIAADISFSEAMEPISLQLFSVRARNCLERMRIRTLRQFMELSEAKVLQWQGAGRKTWNEIADFQKHVHSSESGLREMSERPSQTEIYTGPHSVLPALAGLGLGHFALYSEDLRTLRESGVCKLGDALSSAERYSRLAVVNRRLRKVIGRPKKSAIGSQSLTPEVDYSSFQSMIQTLLCGLVENKRNAAINAEYWGLQSGQRGTLESVAQSFDITRERVRQILKNSERRLEPPACLIPLAHFWKNADEILGQVGGMMSLDSFSRAIAERFEWTPPPNATPLACLLRLTPAYDVNEKQAWVRDRSLVCPECIKAREYLHNLLTGEAQEMHLLDASHRLVSFCQNNCRERAGVTSAPDLAFFQSLTTKDSAICYQDDRLLSRERWQLVYGKRLRSVVRATLGEIGEPAHYSQIAARIREHNLNFREVKDTTVHGSLSNNLEFKVVKSGTYALAEWETKPYRSHAQAIIDLLTHRGGPLTTREIVRVLIRDGEFKESNLCTALASHPAFVRIDQGLYDLRDRQSPQAPEVKVATTAEDIVLFFDDDDSQHLSPLEPAPPVACESKGTYDHDSEVLFLDTPNHAWEDAQDYSEKGACLTNLIQLCTKRLTTSYKPVLMLSLLDSLREKDSLDLKIVAERFVRFYRDRSTRGLQVEHRETAMWRLFAQSTCPTPSQAKTILHSSPIPAFSEAGILSCNDGNICISQDFAATLRKNSDVLRSNATRAIEAYFLNLAEDCQ